MRTLVISDLHLGQVGGVAVLTRPRPLSRLLSAIDDCERLVLLGDALELQEAHWSHSFPVAEPVLRALAERLGPGKQLLLVPGNHDHGLVRDWTRSRGSQLQRENVVPPDASAPLATVMSWLAATRAEVHYPGVWLADGVWATHGQYLNHYLWPVSSWGLHPPSWLRSRQAARPATPAQSRLGLRRAQADPTSLEYLCSPPAPEPVDGAPPPARLVDRYLPSALARLSARLLDLQMRHNVLPAIDDAVRALEVKAEWVIFGHVHRRGPRQGDRLSFWSGAGGSPKLLNTGSWRYEPAVARGLGASGGYWPGGAVMIDEHGMPRSVGLLDGLTERELLAEDR